jgi:serine/threonine protein kinase
MYRGRLGNGTPVTIRTLKMKRSQTAQSFNRHIETISRLRHQNLVSALGHCFEYNLDESTVTQLYIVFEYVQNGNLRSRISRRASGPSRFRFAERYCCVALWTEFLSTEGTEGCRLTWSQRISAAIGVAKGIQFLHGGIIPGLVGNDLRITNVLVDQNHVAKIGSYNIPILAEAMRSEQGGAGNKFQADRYVVGMAVLTLSSSRFQSID